MSIYDSKQGVQRYVKMCDGYDGKELYEVLEKHLPIGCSLLELGSGAGNDAEYLSLNYKFLGSDHSVHFLEHLKAKFTHLNFIPLDARKVELTSNVDCIFSNKVLHHLTSVELAQSLESQSDSLNPNGIIAHSFWLGSGSEQMDGLTIQYYDEQLLLHLISQYFQTVETHVYGEFEAGDSIFVIAKV